MIGDLVFLSSLLGCITLGGYYKKIDDINMKRIYGTGLGLLVVCLICGHHMYHSLVIVWGNILIIKCCDKRYLHYLSLVYTWTYLLYLHFNLKGSQYMHWIHQTIGLRVVGLAFEVHLDSVCTRQAKSMKRSEVISLASFELDHRTMKPTAVDIISYSYFFIGLHKGPYYRWKIFDHHFSAPFGRLGDCRVITAQKIKKALICGIGYLLLQMKYSSGVYYDDSFYKSHDDEFRYLYSFPQIAKYFLYCHMLMLLCTSVCTEAGFGVFPSNCAPLPGHGPTAEMTLLNLATKDMNVALVQEYNFSMLKCFDNEKVLFGPKMRDSVRAWDMPTRYWFWAFIFKNTLKSKRREVRHAFASLVWLLWIGPSLQNGIIAVTLWIHLNLEAEYSQLYNTNNSLMHASWNIGFSIMRVLCLIYLTPCVTVQDSAVVLKYYNSILWSFHIVLLILTGFAIFVHTSHEKRLSRIALHETALPVRV